MILLDHVAQALDLPNLDRRFALGVRRVQRGQIGAAFVEYDYQNPCRDVSLREFGILTRRLFGRHIDKLRVSG